MFRKTINFGVLVPTIVTTLGLFLAVPGSVHAQYLLEVPQSNKIDGLMFINSLLVVKPSTFSLTTIFDLPQTLQTPDPIPAPIVAKVFGPQLPSESTPSSIPTPIAKISKLPDSESTPSADEIPSPKPESTEKPDATPNPSSTPTPKSGLNADVIWDLVNNYRDSIKLPKFQKDDRACTLANSRAPEIEREVTSGTMHAGLKRRDLDYWNTENIIDINSEQAAFNWWIHDKIHRDAIEGDYKYSCVACSGQACAEEFTNFQPK